MIKLCFIIFIIILILYYFKKLIFKGGRFNFKCLKNESAKDYVYLTLLPQLRRIYAKSLKSNTKKFTNIINQKLFNLTFNDYSINNLKKTDYIIHFLFTTSGQSSLNNSKSLFEDLRTYVNTKYNELVGIYGGKMNHKGGLIKNILNRKQYKKLCIIFSKVDLDIIERNIEGKNTIYKIQFKKELTDIKINFNKQIDNIITKINSNEPILEKVDYIKQTLNRLYKPIFNKYYLLDTFGLYNNTLQKTGSFPPNYNFIFHMDYIKNLEEDTTEPYYNIKNISKLNVPNDYKFSDLDSSYNFYMTPTFNDSYNSALYLDSEFQSYILYYPNKNDSKARTMFYNNNISHKSIIKINNLIFTLDNIIYDNNGPIKFNINKNSITYDLFNQDIIKTYYYYKNEKARFINKDFKDYEFYNFISNRSSFSFIKLYTRPIIVNRFIGTRVLTNLIAIYMYNSLFNELLPLISNNKTNQVKYYDYFKVIKVPQSHNEELYKNTSEIDKEIISIASRAGIRDFNVATTPGNLFIFRDLSQINNELFNNYDFIKYNYYDSLLGSSDYNYIVKLRNRTNYTTQKHSFEIDNDLSKIGRLSYYFVRSLQLYDKGYLLTNLNKTRPTSELFSDVEESEEFLKIFLDQNKINKIIDCMLRYHKSIYNKIPVLSGYTQDNYNKLYSFNEDIFKNNKEYKIISLLFNDRTPTLSYQSSNMRRKYRDAYDSNSGLGLGEILVKSKNYHELLKEFNELKLLSKFFKNYKRADYDGNLVYYWPPESQSNYSFITPYLGSDKMPHDILMIIIDTYLVILDKIWFADEKLANEILDFINNVIYYYIDLCFKKNKYCGKEETLIAIGVFLRVREITNAKEFSKKYGECIIFFKDFYEKGIDKKMKLLYTKYNSLQNKTNLTGKKLNIENHKFTLGRVGTGKYTNLVFSSKDDYLLSLYKIE